MKSHVKWALLAGLLITSGIVILDSGQTTAEQQTDQSSATTQTTQPATSETIVYVTKTGEKYHAEGCRYLKKSRIRMTLKDARAKGYTPCSVCRPDQ